MNKNILIVLALALFVISCDQVDGFRMLRSRINRTKVPSLPRLPGAARRTTANKMRPITTTTIAPPIQYSNRVNGLWARIGKRSDAEHSALLLTKFCNSARERLDLSDNYMVYVFYSICLDDENKSADE